MCRIPCCPLPLLATSAGVCHWDNIALLIPRPTFRHIGLQSVMLNKLCSDLILGSHASTSWQLCGMTVVFVWGSYCIKANCLSLFRLWRYWLDKETTFWAETAYHRISVEGLQLLRSVYVASPGSSHTSRFERGVFSKTALRCTFYGTCFSITAIMGNAKSPDVTTGRQVSGISFLTCNVSWTSWFLSYPVPVLCDNGGEVRKVTKFSKANYSPKLYAQTRDW